MKLPLPPCPPIMGGSENLGDHYRVVVFGKPYQNPPLLGGRGAKRLPIAGGFVLLALLPFLTGCPSPNTASAPTTLPAAQNSGPNADRSAGAFAQTDPWILTTSDPKVNRGNHGVFIGNGDIGAGIGVSGLPETLFLAGVYNAQENLRNFSSYLLFPKQAVGVETPYTQTLDMKRGLLTTKAANRTVVVFASAMQPGLLVIHETFTSGMQSPPIDGAPQVIGEGHLVHQSIKEADGSLTTYLAPVPDSSPIRLAQRPRTPAAYAALLADHKAAWQKRWQAADIQIDGDPEAQQLVHKLMFDLLQSTHPGASDSIAPESLSGDFYKGHIFWDAEIWMFPALLAQHPDYARALLDYRFKHLPQAQAQAKKSGYAGADFPWESAATGNEAAPNGFSTGRHVTAGVGWAVWQYYLATGDKKWLKERGGPLLFGVANYFVSRVKKNGRTGKYDINDVFGPDELKGKVNNNTYTNAMVANVLRYAGEAAKITGYKANPQWVAVAQNIALPFDKAAHRYLARENDTGEKTKQADGELVLYPADLPMDQQTADATFDFHKIRPIKNGPAMTDSVHALIAARLGRVNEAEKYFRDSYRPFVRGSFLLFSEKRSLDRCVFTTGAGGVLQSVVYGFGGLDFAQPTGLIKTPPTLPKGWKKLTITGIQRDGKRYTLTATPEKRMLTPEK